MTQPKNFDLSPAERIAILECRRLAQERTPSKEGNRVHAYNSTLKALEDAKTDLERGK